METLKHCEYCKINVNRRVIWACRQCGKHFCTACFEHKVSPKAFQEMYHNAILCPECYLKKYGKTNINKTEMKPLNNKYRYSPPNRANLF